jgi:AcrR family transcriptional regulator
VQPAQHRAGTIVPERLQSAVECGHRGTPFRAGLEYEQKLAYDTRIPKPARRRATPQLNPRKAPRQARSRRTNEDLIEAAARVLAREGAAAFNTNRVAEAAGVSIGSLYQYYPNKAALLLALHERDAEASWRELEALLSDARTAPLRRLERLVLRFFEMETGAPDQHAALAEARAIVPQTPEFRAFEERVVERMQSFVEECFPKHRRDARFLASLCFTVMTATGERIATRGLPVREVARVASATAGMLSSLLAGGARSRARD